MRTKVDEHYDRLHGRPTEQVALELLIMLTLSIIGASLTFFCLCFNFWRDYFKMVSAALKFRKLNSLAKMDDSEKHFKLDSDNTELNEIIDRNLSSARESSQQQLTTSQTVTSWIENSKVYHL